MCLQTIQDELTKQMAERGLKFNIDCDDELREVVEESSEYIDEIYDGPDAEKVMQYLDETMLNYPEHIEPIREYIQHIAA